MKYCDVMTLLKVTNAKVCKNRQESKSSCEYLSGNAKEEITNCGKKAIFSIGKYKVHPSKCDLINGKADR